MPAGGERIACAPSHTLLNQRSGTTAAQRDPNASLKFVSESGSDLADMGPKQVDIDRDRADCAKLGTTSTNIGQIWPGNGRPISTDSGPNSTNLGSGSTKFGPDSARFVQIWPESTN